MARISLNILITNDDIERLDRLSSIMHGASKTEIVKRSLKVNELILSKVEAGCKIKVVKPDGTETELVIV